MSDSGEHGIARQILSEAREEVARADAKASMLLATITVVGSLIAAAVLAGEWSPSELAGLWIVTWWLGVSAGWLGVCCLGLAVFPRIGNRVHPQPALTYFNDVALLRDVSAVRETLARIDPLERDLTQLVAISSIARRKYLWIRRAIVFIAICLALLLATALAAY